MRNKAARLHQVGFDIAFGPEFYLGLTQQRVNSINEPQSVQLRSQGVKIIEKQAKNKQLYYMGNQAFEYCVQNVKGIEQVDDAVRYEKVEENSRIDVFDAAVFACMRMLNDMQKTNTARNWLNS